jgi:hypothetical protein
MLHHAAKEFRGGQLGPRPTAREEVGLWAAEKPRLFSVIRKGSLEEGMHKSVYVKEGRWLGRGRSKQKGE